MKITMATIARESGCSISAVSQVLNNHPHALSFRQETRDRIQATVERLDFQRNESAREVRTGQIHQIALLASFGNQPWEMNPSANLLPRLLKAATRRGYGLRIYDADHLEESLASILSYRIDKILCGTDQHIIERAGAFARQHQIAFLSTGYHSFGNYPGLISADRDSVHEIVRYLHQQGHCRIGYFGLGTDGAFKRERFQGYLDGLKDLGLPAREEYIFQNPDEPALMDQILRSLKEDPENAPTALCTHADCLACHLMNHLIPAGIRVPGDLSIFGFGGSFLGEHAIVPLSTVEHSRIDFGEIAMDFLLDDSKTRNPRHKQGLFQFPPTLIIRESVRKISTTNPREKSI